MKTKHNWPPTKREVELLYIKARAWDEYESKLLQKDFVDNFMHNLGTILAYTPAYQWDRVHIRAAFNAARLKYPLGCQEYTRVRSKIGLH
jgi:hypothetical protein